MTDPVTLAVLRGALKQVADEMDLHPVHDRAISPITSATRRIICQTASACGLIVEAA